MDQKRRPEELSQTHEETEMKRMLMTALIGVVFSQTAVLAAKLDLAKSKNEVEFLAIGNPSALKIHGEAKEEGGKAPVKGDLTFAGTDVTGKVTCLLDSFDTGIGMRNKHMKEKYLETGKFPEAQFTLTELKLPSAATDVKAKDVPFKGNLTLHGVTKPVAGTATIERAKDKANTAFEFKIKASDFAIQSPSFMGITMADEVNVNVKFEGPVL
jgi:polyisoprenoid-binding protein YceI